MSNDQYLTAGKVKRLVQKLSEFRYRHTLPFQTILSRKAAPAERDIPAVDKKWIERTLPFSWGERDGFWFFHKDIAVPKTWKGKTVYLLLMPNDFPARELANAESLVVVNGKIIGSNDCFHRELVLMEKAKGGERLSVDMRTWCGLNANMMGPWKELVFAQASLAALHGDVESLFIRLTTLVQTLELFATESYEYNHLLGIANRAVSLLAFGTSSRVFDASVRAALGVFTEAVNSDPSRPTVVAAGHAHIDVAWLWRLSHTREKAERTFANVIHLMELYPHYHFSQSQPQLYRYIQEDNPELFAEIKKRVKEKRFEPVGGMWVEADCNLISGESLVRQMLFGQRYYQREFGMMTDVLWLPDVFGYSWALPQIMLKSGQKYFMTTKIAWSQYNKPDFDTFVWRGLDGSEVLTHYVHGGGGYNGEQTPQHIMNTYRAYAQKDVNDELLAAFGHGDGGGGPTKEMLERGPVISQLPFMPRVVHGRVTDFFKRLNARVRENPRLPVIDGELYLELHRGTYTSQAQNKRSNRRAESLLQSAEKIAVLAALFGKAYPAETLTSGWETLLRNQFHDIIPGSSIPEVYEDSAKEYERIFKDMETIITGSMRHLGVSMKTSEHGFLIYNPLPWIRTDVVQLTREVVGVLTATHTNTTVPLQTVTILGERRTMAYIEAMPAGGMCALAETPPAPKKVKAPSFGLAAGARSCTNKYFIIKFDAAGRIVSLVDKRRSRELVAPGSGLNDLTAFEDIPLNWDAWDTDIFYTEKPYPVTSQSFSLKGKGPLCAVYRRELRFRSSTIRQDIVIYAHLDRIDIHTEADWREHQTLLKAAFPVDMHTASYTAEIQFGEIERANNWNDRRRYAQFESVAHRWVDLSENDYGVSLINDCKYGHDVRGNCMRITLIKAGTYPDANADIGIHRFSYAIYPHEGHVKDSLTVETGYRFNNPVFVTETEPHNGDRDTVTFIKVYANHTVLDTVKRAEDVDAYVLRFYQSKNMQENVTVVIERPLKSVVETDLLERPTDNVKLNPDGFSFIAKPFEIRTFLVTLAQPKKR
ncbi:MAG: alpha-mannosidase [Spirochaetes bacterium]|nr:alpha-mannosidase [Spirochaetota bacterium]